MMKYFFLLSAITLRLPAQLKLPRIPAHDSITVKKTFGSKFQRCYYKSGKVVLESTFADHSSGGGQTMFMFSYASNVDSIFVFIKKDNIDVYQYAKNSLTHEQFSYSSPLFRYTAYDPASKLKTEEGSYYVSRNALSNPYQAPKYKIGKWLTYHNKKITRTIDYDAFEIDGQKIFFTDAKRAPLNRMKTYVDSMLVSTFGKSFTEKYIRFNPDKSQHGENAEYMTPNQPENHSLFYEPDLEVQYADLCYDIRLNDKLRFDVIMVRIDTHLHIIGERVFKNYNDQKYNLCVGLDSSLKRSFSENATDFDRIAREYKMHYPSPKCFLYMDWKHTAGLHGKLMFVMEDEYKFESKSNGWLSYSRRVTIDPVSGSIVEDKSTTGLTADE